MQKPGANKIGAFTREDKVAGGKGATTLTSRVDWYNLFVLLLSTIAVSGIVSLYVLCMAWLNLKNTDSDPLERAAMSAAADLLKINAVSRDFGTLGIADYFNSDNNYDDSQEGADREVRSFNTVGSLIRTSLFVAKRYQLGPMADRAASDLQELNGLEDELRKKFLAAIKDDGTGKIYQHIKRILIGSTRGGEHLESLQVKLGFAKNKLDISAIQSEPEDDTSYCVSGRLKARTPIMVPLVSERLVLHQQSKETAILNCTDFVEDLNSNLAARAAVMPAAMSAARSIAMPAATFSPIPTVILIEAQFSTKSDKRGLITSKRAVCVVAGAGSKHQHLASARPEGSLAISFPQGKPNAFISLESILLYKDWQGKGEWQQAVQGTVPGPGQLAPSAVPVLKAMNGSESLSIALYHWLRQLSNPVSPSRLAALLKSPWRRPPIPADAGKALIAVGEEDNSLDDSLGDDAAGSLQVNSGLLKDSDARIFALLYQNKPSEAGQRALIHCFQALPSKFPPSTLPVVVDSDGHANLPGRRGFDQTLAFDFLTGIYSTNLAAQDSLAASKLIQSSALRAYRSSKERLFLAQTELDSLTSRLRGIVDKKEAKALQNEIDWRNNRIAYEINEQKKQLKAISLAGVAIVNATVVAGQSFECGSKLFQLARAGINRLDNLPNNLATNGLANASASAGTGTGMKSGYLLGKRYIFCPMTESLQENDILDEAARAFEAAASEAQSPSQTTNTKYSDKQRSPWLAKKVTIFGTVRQFTDMPTTQIMVEGRSLSDLKAETPPVLKAEPAVLVYTPRLLAGGADKSPLYFRDYPFKGLAVPESQLVYYCQNGYRSSNKVAWSILVRDLVANRDISSSHQRLGLPLIPAMTGWCKRALNITSNTERSTTQNSTNDRDETCPGLAGEWQLRSPVMFLNNTEGGILKGTTLSDPESGQRVPQIPPVGPDLM